MYENDLNTAAYAVSITIEGEVMGIAKLENLIKRKGGWNEKEAMEKNRDLESLRSFILKHRSGPITNSIFWEVFEVQKIQREWIQMILGDPWRYVES